MRSKEEIYSKYTPLEWAAISILVLPLFVLILILVGGLSLVIWPIVPFTIYREARKYRRDYGTKKS